MKLHKILFFVLVFLIPIQTRILFNPETAYVSWYFNYHLGFFYYLTDILLLACFAHWLVFDTPKWSVLKQSEFLWIICGFIALMLLSLFHVEQIELGIYMWFRWSLFFALLLYIYETLREKRDFSITGLIFLVSAMFQAALGWFQFHMQHMIGLSWLGEYIAPIGTSGLSNIETATGNIIRAYGTMPHPNVLSAFLVMGIIWGLLYVSRESSQNTINAQKYRLGALLVGLFILYLGLFTTFSRIAWSVSLLVSLGFLIYWLTLKHWKAFLALICVMIVSCATIAILYSSSFQARVSHDDSVSLNDRKFFNQQGINLAKENIWLGVGVGNYVPTLIDSQKLEPWQYQPPHNILIFILAELGIVGLILFILLVIELFRRLKNVSWELIPSGIVCLGIIFLVMGQFDHYFVTIQQGRLMFAVTLGLIAALPNAYDYKKLY